MWSGSSTYNWRVCQKRTLSWSIGPRATKTRLFIQIKVQGWKFEEVPRVFNISTEIKNYFDALQKLFAQQQAFQLGVNSQQIAKNSIFFQISENIEVWKNFILTYWDAAAKNTLNSVKNAEYGLWNGVCQSKHFCKTFFPSLQHTSQLHISMIDITKVDFSTQTLLNFNNIKSLPLARILTHSTQ